MAIAFVGAGTRNASAVTTFTCTYAATAGNIVCAFINHAGAITSLSVKDNDGQAMTAGPTVTFGSSTNVATAWYYTAVGAGIANYVATWASSFAVGMGVVEYSGVTGGVNAALAANTATGTSAAPTITVTTQDNNDWITVGMNARVNAITNSVGNSRVSETGAALAKIQVSDNTVATAGPLTVSGTCTSQAWAAIALELRLTAVVAAAANHNLLMMMGAGT